jgi:hypothetical protein
MNYLIQKPGDVGFKTYSPEGLRVAVASGEVQLDWQARNNGKENNGTGSAFDVLRVRQRDQFAGRCLSIVRGPT